jgi:hypothetical protein
VLALIETFPLGQTRKITVFLWSNYPIGGGGAPPSLSCSAANRILRAGNLHENSKGTRHTSENCQSSEMEIKRRGNCGDRERKKSACYSLLAAARAASAASSTKRRASRQQVDGAIGRRVRVAGERRRLKSTCQRMSCPSARKNHRKPTHSLTRW